jgi:hypothetical protein
MTAVDATAYVSQCRAHLRFAADVAFAGATLRS